MAARLRTRWGALGALTLTLLIGFAVAIPVSQASAQPRAHAAAARVTGCFGYNGTNYNNLATTLQYYHFATRTWTTLPLTPVYTSGYGCVRWNIYGSWTRFKRIRIKATGLVAGSSGVFQGFSPYYAPSGTGRYLLGTGQLAFIPFPTSVPPVPQTQDPNITRSWLDQITGGANCGTLTDPALQVACYMDQHGLVGNTVVLHCDSYNRPDPNGEYICK